MRRQASDHGHRKPMAVQPFDKKLLVLHQGALGDFIATFPVLRALRGLFAQIDGICRAGFGRLAAYLGIFDHFYPLEAARFASLYTEKIEPAVADLLAAYDHILLLSFSQSLEKSARHIAGEAVCRIPPWPKDGEKGPVTEFLAEKMIETGMFDARENEIFMAPVSAKADTSMQAGSKIIISPGAGSTAKRWPLEGFLKVAETLAQRGFYPEFVLGPAESDLGRGLSVRRAAAMRVHGPAGLPQLADLLRTAAGFIGNDSAAGHLAAFLGLVTVVIFGPSDPVRWRPHGRRVAVVRSPRDCSPCNDPAKTGCTRIGCMKQVSPQMVLNAIAKWIRSEMSMNRN
jgi:heptosyltransferase-3